jgi:hypothetical protein
VAGEGSVWVMVMVVVGVGKLLLRWAPTRIIAPRQ